MELLKFKQNKLIERKEELKKKMGECNDKQPTFTTEDSRLEYETKQMESEYLHKEWMFYFEEEKKINAQLELIDELLEE